MRDSSSMLEGRNVCLEALRRGTSIDRLIILEGRPDASLSTVIREAKKRGIRIEFVPRSRLDQISETGKHQGVIAYTASMDFASVEDILKAAGDKSEPPLIVMLDGITDPHNLGAIIRTANVCGAHGVIIKKHQSVGLTATVAKASAGAIMHTPVARVTNLVPGENMYELSLTGPMCLIIGDEGKGVSKLVRESCDYCGAIPMKGEISSLNASVAAGVFLYEIVRQRMSG